MAVCRLNKIYQVPTMEEYGDHEIFGQRKESNKSLDSLKASNDSECILFAIGTFAAKDKFKLRDLIGTDKRLRQMIQGLEIEHPWPIQRYSWPKIHQSTFTNVFISPEATGKTHALLLYLVAKCISASPMNEAEEMINSETSNQYVPTDMSELDELINHPRYIIISSSQDNVDTLKRKIDLMKEKAYGIHVTGAKRRLLAPIARTINIQQDNDKLALRCNESEILISSPPALLKCLNEGYIDFAKCKKVFFDDLDIALQLQNNTIREIIKRFLVQTDALTQLGNVSISSDSESNKENGHNSNCQLHIFTRKWTELVRHFIGNLFSQRILLFASVAEAAIYTNLRFEIECCKDNLDILSKVSNMISVLIESSQRSKIAIVCRTDEEAEATCNWLNEQGHKSKLLREENGNSQIGSSACHRTTSRDIVLVISDEALEFEVEYSTRRKPLNDVMHLIHATIPEEMPKFDQRFRLLYKNIQDNKSEMTSTLMLSQSLKQRTARQIYDLISRSGPTLKSTKLIMRDFIASQTSHVCWRWATTGLCRLEKLSRDDRFGSYCFDRHAFGQSKKDENWPKEGLVGISLTHIVSPSEFYFRFETVRSFDTGTWTKFDKTGKHYMRVLQTKLNYLKDLPTRSVALDRIKIGKIYGVFFPQECRVDRVRLLDDLKIETKNSTMINKELEYSKQVRVFKIDYGSMLEVYVKNLIELPEEINLVPAQCHRGLHLGYKPTNNEPNWAYKSKRQFYETVIEKSVGAWLRLNSDGCFWFENMHVSRKLTNTDSEEEEEVNPHRKLQEAGLAEATSAEPSGMPASNRAHFYSKWNHLELTKASQYAYIDRSTSSSEVFLLNVLSNLDVLIRLVKFNKGLISLEANLMAEFQSGKLKKQEYLAPGTISLARIAISPDDVCINRVKIVQTMLEQETDIESPTSMPTCNVKVECLDHGDILLISAEDIFMAEIAHVQKLPFQAIRRKLANLDPKLLQDPSEILRLRNLLIDLTRDSCNNNLKVLCKLNEQGDLYLYLPDGHKNNYVPLYKRLSEFNIKLQLSVEEGFEGDIELKPEECSSDERMSLINSLIIDLLRDMASNAMQDLK